jgi:uncharacterized protein YybS (DUF2232 family)
MGTPDEIEGVTPTPPHTHTLVVLSLFSKSVLNWRGGSVYNMIFWKFEILLSFFLIIVGLVKNNGR